MIPQTRYAKSDGVSIAYQVLGDGPIDLLVVPGWISNVDSAWEEPSIADFYHRLASFSRLILFDKRGTGLSDRVDLPSLEVRMDDVRAVLDAVGSPRAALFGYSEGGPMCALFAATYPERTSAIVLDGSYARMMWAADYPFGRTPQEHAAFLVEIERDWGAGVGLERRAPSRAHDERFRQWWARFQRASASPKAAANLLRMNAEIDIRHVLPSIRVPTLVLHAVGDRALPLEAGRYLARHIPGAQLVELPSEDHLPYLTDADRILAEVEEFLTGMRHDHAESERVLATVLFTDIVGATERAGALGDRRWRQLLEQHHQLVRRELARFRGRELDTAGDGFFAAFDGPARAVRCACAVSSTVKALGLEVRAGAHTGECEVMGDKYGGIAVHIGARVAARAAPGEVLVSSTVKDLVAGSGLAFEDRGRHALKGVPGDWQLYAVAQ
jgi:pimeloyl-ACP methyl ester carboxylesterase